MTALILRHKRFLKFCAVGASGVAVNEGQLHHLTELAGWNYKFSSVAAIECAILNNFLWNYLWTWRDRDLNTAGLVLRSLVKFNLSSGAVALIINWGILVGLTEYAGVPYRLSNLAGIALGTIANFILSHFWAFSGPSAGKGAL
jgi:dolichol-phosphate mannosyltransferase